MPRSVSASRSASAGGAAGPRFRARFRGRHTQFGLASGLALGFGPGLRGGSVRPSNASTFSTNDRPPGGRPVASGRCIASGKAAAVEPSRCRIGVRLVSRAGRATCGVVPPPGSARRGNCVSGAPPGTNAIGPAGRAGELPVGHGCLPVPAMRQGPKAVGASRLSAILASPRGFGKAARRSAWRGGSLSRPRLADSRSCLARGAGPAPPCPSATRAPAVAAGRCEGGGQRGALRDTAGVGPLPECGRRRPAQDAEFA